MVVLSVLLHIVHVFVILVNSVGWAIPRLRKLQLITLGLTLGSWSILGIFYGFGYCFLTDWHWDILRELGEANLPPNYIEYAVEWLTQRDWDSALVGRWIGGVFVGILIMTAIVHIRAFVLRRHKVETA